MEREEQLIVEILKGNPLVMRALSVVAMVNSEFWIGGGLLRNAVWDFLHGYDETPINDIDVIFFDPLQDRILDRQWEQRLHTLLPGVPWSVKNQAWMHEKSHLAPFASLSDAISKWTETATCVAAKLVQPESQEDCELDLIAPYGVGDLLNLKIMPTPFSRQQPEIYRKRLAKKGWSGRWPRLTLCEI